MSNHTPVRSERPVRPTSRSFLSSVTDSPLTDPVPIKPEGSVSHYPPLQVVQPPVEAPPPNVMDLLVERYTRFSALIARNRVELDDLVALRTVCSQVQASAAEMEAEARRRRRLVQYIEECADLLSGPGR